mmetsp:Transcript_19491/g.77572  ORF Transcript_19491/g.77572 Transcript_19491/m.77572 type:complete len:188 (-) Transcript_19491:347-910(-)
MRSPGRTACAVVLASAALTTRAFVVHAPARHLAGRHVVLTRSARVGEPLIPTDHRLNDASPHGGVMSGLPPATPGPAGDMLATTGLPKLWTDEELEPIVLKAAAFAQAIADGQSDELRRRRKARKHAAVASALDRARRIWTGAVVPAALGLTSWFLTFHLLGPVSKSLLAYPLGAANLVLLSMYFSH